MNSMINKSVVDMDGKLWTLTKKLYLLTSIFNFILLPFHIKCHNREFFLLQNKCRFRFSMQNLLI